MKNESREVEVIPFHEVVETLSKSLKIPNKTIIAVLSGLTSLAATELKKGKQLQIKDLGRLAVREGRQDPKAPGAAVKRAVLIPNQKFKSDVGI